LWTASGSAGEEISWPRIALSKDNTPIACEVYGRGEPTLVFVHGWSCDARYWRAQVPHFARKHRVVTLDLAGHGHSGLQRSQYTMRAFGEDVRAAAAAAGGERVILIGHSMGGSVIAEAARLMPDRVIGLIGVDTLENVEYAMTREAVDHMTAPLRTNFRTGVRAFVEGMFYTDTDPRLREWILSDMAAAPPAVALSAMEEMMEQYITGEAARIFEEIPLPVVVVKGDLWPVDPEANRRHMASFDVLVVEGADHFLMMNRPEAFNRALEKAIDRVSTGAGRP
jgi:pimeloyl-ACP methyl ester carboxylesterase